MSARLVRILLAGVAAAVGSQVAAAQAGGAASSATAQPTNLATEYSPYVGRDYPTRVFWGDTHLHTANSGDAVGYGNRLGPEEAFRFARGEEVTSSTGVRARLGRPLDFLVVADHAEGLGLVMEILAGNPAFMGDATLKRWHDMMSAGLDQGTAVAKEMARSLGENKLPPAVSDPAIAGPVLRSVWQKYTATAEKYNEPGRFTALLGYEWTSAPGGNNLHRVVVFRDGKDKVDQILPFSALRSEDPEKLWEFMAGYEQKTGGRVLAIPHNANLSNGRMFAFADFEGRPLGEGYARARRRWEPLAEVTQTKGDGETHPFLSPDDAFASYERAGWDNGNLTLQERKSPVMYQYEYARSALRNGLKLERDLGVNPFKFGMIGSTDSHTSLSTTEEDNFFGKLPNSEPSPGRGPHPATEYGGLSRYGWQYQSAGLAAVWARENTREALWDAMMRKEVYATTGTRMTVRFFGGWDFESADARRRSIADAGYARGVPMGGDLPAGPPSRAPTFLIAALKDPVGANLDRIQVVKGWLDAKGQSHERVYDVAWAGDLRRKPGKDGKLPAVGNTVNVAEATWTNTIGAPDLATVWRDPGFDPAERAFYYVRVLEIPTPRWTTYDAKFFNVKIPEGAPATIQERAYTSPIWYSPKN